MQRHAHFCLTTVSLHVCFLLRTIHCSSGLADETTHRLLVYSKTSLTVCLLEVLLKQWSEGRRDSDKRKIDYCTTHWAPLDGTTLSMRHLQQTKRHTANSVTHRKAQKQTKE